MGAVSLIHNERLSIPVGCLRNSRDIRYDSLISGRDHKNCLNLRIRGQHVLHILRQDSPLNAKISDNLGIHVICFQMVEEDPVVSRLVTVPAHEDMTAPLCGCKNGRQQPAAASIDQIIRPICPVD